MFSLTYDGCNDRMYALAQTATGVQLITINHKSGAVEIVGVTDANLSALTSELLAPRCVSSTRAVLADGK